MTELRTWPDWALAMVERRWDNLTGFDKAPVAIVCPRCKALVVSTMVGDPYDGRLDHIRWHIIVEAAR